MSADYPADWKLAPIVDELRGLRKILGAVKEDLQSLSLVVKENGQDSLDAMERVRQTMLQMYEAC